MAWTTHQENKYLYELAGSAFFFIAVLILLRSDKPYGTSALLYLLQSNIGFFKTIKN